MKKDNLRSICSQAIVLAGVLFLAPLSWGAERKASVNLGTGKKVFLSRCAVCHGPKGDGQGVAAKAMKVKPRNFIKGKYRLGGEFEQLFKTVSQGIPNSPMPAWKGELSSQEIKSVVLYILSLKKQ